MHLAHVCLNGRRLLLGHGLVSLGVLCILTFEVAVWLSLN